MQNVRVGLIQVAWLGSRERMMEAYRPLVAEAVERGASLVCLPEFSLLPYFPGVRDRAGFQWAEPMIGGVTERFFSALSGEYGVTIVASLFEMAENGKLYDTATIHRGELIGYTRKIHIPSGEGYHETDFFGGGDTYPVYDLDSVKIATPTCYDQWFPELARIYAMNGAEFIYYPTAIGAEPTDPNFDSKDAWQTVQRGHAVANGVYVGAANRVGEENGVRFYGSSFVCDPTGKILAQAGRDTTEVIVADLDAYTLNHYRELFPLIHQRKPALYTRITEAVEAQPPARWLNEKL
jgi:N-carbamoylputrescine amidase